MIGLLRVTSDGGNVKLLRATVHGAELRSDGEKRKDDESKQNQGMSQSTLHAYNI